MLVAGALGLGLFAVAHYYVQPPLWDKNLGLHDDRYYFGPNAYYLDTSLQNGSFPWWNPMVYSGMPFAADPQASAFYPPHLIRSLLTPAFDPYATAASLQLLLLLHVFLAGIGAHVLARAHGRSLPAGIVAGLIYMAGPFSIIYTTEFYIFPLMTAWTPWLLWLARRALHAPDRSGAAFYTLLTALCYGMSILVGFPQLTVYIGIILGLYALLDGLTRIAWTHPEERVSSLLRAMGRVFCFTLPVALLGAMLAAVLLLPALEFSQHSARTDAAGLSMATGAQNFDALHLLKCLVVFPGNTWAPQGLRAAGIGSLLALLLALTHKDRKTVFVFIALFLLFSDLSLGPPFPAGRVLAAFDYFNIMISPWRAGAFPGLFLAIAVALGIDAAGIPATSRTHALFRSGVLIAAGGAMLAILAFWLADAPLFQPNASVWVLPLLTLLALCAFTWFNAPRTATILIALLIGLETAFWGGQMLPEYVRTKVGGPLPERAGEVRGLWADNRRPAHFKPSWNMWTLEGAANGYGPLYPGRTRQILCRPAQESNYRIILSEDDVQVENQRGNLFVKRSLWLARQWVAGPLPSKQTLYPAATTVFLPEAVSGAALPVPEVTRESVEKHPLSDRVDRINLSIDDAVRKTQTQNKERMTTLRLPPFDQDGAHSVLMVGYTARTPVDVTLVCRSEDGVERKGARQQTQVTREVGRMLTFPLPDGGRTVVTLKWPEESDVFLKITKAFVLRDQADEDAHLRIVERRPNSIEVAVSDLPGGRLLLFVDSAYPGWRAGVDGNETQMLLANDGFKAVAVPAGSHTVRFEYHPVWARTGITISAFTAACLVCALAGIAWRRSRGHGVKAT